MNKELRIIKKFETYFLTHREFLTSYFLLPTSNRGFIALTTVLVLLAVTVGIAVSVTYSSIGEAQSGLALFKGEDNLQFIEGCAEDALLKARSDSTFGDPVGTPETITRPEGTCSVTVRSKTGVTWVMDVTSSTTTYKRTVRIVFDRNTTGITLTSWKEL